MSRAQLVIYDPDTRAATTVRDVEDPQVRDDGSVTFRGGMLRTQRPYVLAATGTYTVGQAVDPTTFNPDEYGCLVRSRRLLSAARTLIARHEVRLADIEARLSRLEARP
jgi:hypothetical protein